MSARKCTQIPSNDALALSRAKLARMIAAMLSEPNPQWLQRFYDPGLRGEMRSAAIVLGIDQGLIAAIFDSLETGGANEEAYRELMGHTVRSGCPPYELEYRSSEVFQQSQTLADISGFYRAFGFESNGPLLERADHVVAQWEFLAVLAMMESTARTDEQILCCVNAQNLFLSEHAAGWMVAYFERIRRSDNSSFWAMVANAADALLQEWCVARGVSAGPKWLELRPICDEDSTITCGAAGAVELGPTLAGAMAERE